MFRNLTLAIALGFILGAVALGFLPLLWLGFGQGHSILMTICRAWWLSR